MHALFLDFRKAFDLVDHATLLEKLATMNISRIFWNWVQSYLSGRTLQVKLPGVVSCSGEVIAGVPQGGVISPTLFNVFINYLMTAVPLEVQSIPASTLMIALNTNWCRPEVKVTCMMLW